MLNYVAILWNNFWIFNKWSDAGFQMTPTFDKAAWLPRLADYARQYPAFSGITLHFGVILALITTVIVWWILERSKWGYEIKLIGDNKEAARYAGINIARNIILVMMFSGALAGLAGMSEISGVVHRLQERISPGYGFTGIIIAWLAKLNPVRGRPGLDPLRRADRGRTRNPAVRAGAIAAGHYSLHGHQQRVLPAL